MAAAPDESLPAPDRRFFLIVLDGCGAGALPDAPEYGPDDPHSNTLANTARAAGGLRMPHLAALGWGNITPMAGVPPRPDAPAAWGRLAEISRGKDTVTGHWEMMGVHTRVPFPTYPRGFPTDIMHPFEERIGTTTLGNYPASGTQILQQLGEAHRETGYPIVYTSADSVFQIAAHEDPDVFGLDRLYEICEVARELLAPPHHVARVIARPFVGSGPESFRRTENRRDYPLPLPHPTVLDTLVAAGRRVHAVGKIAEIFSGQGITSSEPTTNNPDHIAALLRAVQGVGPGANADFVFANLEDFDMLYGHRNDPVSFARLLAEFDASVGEMLPHLRPGDLVGITADHGNDPTTPSTDHSREHAPLLLLGPSLREPADLGTRTTLADWGATVADWLGVDWSGQGDSFLPSRPSPPGPLSPARGEGERRDLRMDLPKGSRELKEVARGLRQKATAAEELLWEFLRGRKMQGYKLRRQHPIGHFITDFFCDDARLVIEIDGAIHQEPSQQERDRNREECLREHTLSLLRFTNEEVFTQTDRVLQTISDFVASHGHERPSKKPRSSSPSPRAGERGPGGEGREGN